MKVTKQSRQLPVEMDGDPPAVSTRVLQLEQDGIDLALRWRDPFSDRAREMFRLSEEQQAQQRSSR